MTRKPPRPKDPAAPAHLAAETRTWWAAVVAAYRLEQHHLRLLRLACETWDRGQQARRKLDKDGLTFQDRHGQPKARPEVAVERDSRIAFARLMRTICLAVLEV